MPKGGLIRACPTTQNPPKSFSPSAQSHWRQSVTAIRIFEFDTENGGFEIGRVSRPLRGWSGIELRSRDLPECTDCDNYKRYLASLISKDDPADGWTISLFLRPRVMYRSIENPEKTYPVAGIHYIQQDDIQLERSALTTVDGSFDGLFFDASPDFTTVRSMPIIFAAGPIDRVRGIDPAPDSFDYDYQNDGFPARHTDSHFGAARLARRNYMDRKIVGRRFAFHWAE